MAQSERSPQAPSLLSWRDTRMGAASSARGRPLWPAALALLAPLALMGNSPAEPGAPQINPTGYTRAAVCGTCHQDIYNSWKRSLHALSLTDPIFESAYMQALKEDGDKARKICLSCHAPMTMANSDFTLSQAETRDGVSCDFCHTVTAVHVGDAKRTYTLEPGLVKRSVLKKAASPAHEVAYSELHTTAEFCGGCHNYVAPSGAAIMSTYQEWRDGPYARQGVQCQECHMVKRAGNVVRPDLKATGGGFHLHDLIRDTTQLRSALAVRVTRATRSGSTLIVDVELENVGSGHKIPTGIPSREVVLTVAAQSGDHAFKQERRYRKVVADANQHVLNTDFEMLLHGATILNDNRIGPREKRRERFTFAVPPDGAIRVSAKATYRYAPMILKQELIDIELGSSERVVH
jgi:hypothetical protein